ncbi:MAG TPA: outer membrane beta-barrel protein, partial [bacterium]|nr:outer membrane beta-barrel protein [bacterium]
MRLAPMPCCPRPLCPRVAAFPAVRPAAARGLGTLLLGAALLAGVLSGLGAGLPRTAQARPGFYLGAGLAVQTADDDLNGSTAYINADGTQEYLVGKLDAGSGIGLDIGYGFNRWWGVEYLVAVTAHTATHDFTSSDSPATLGTGLLGVRLT